METGPPAASASAPTHPGIELEPPQWQPRIMWVSARMLCGATAFFFISFVFAYFYLRSLDSNKSWKIGQVNAPVGWGIAILVVLILSAVSLRAAVADPRRTTSAGGAALALALLSIVLQVIEWASLGFGPASGGYASVFVGYTVVYAVFTLACAYWIATQVATAWRQGKERTGATPADVLSDTETTQAGLAACSFFWNFYVFNGLVLFVLLYLL
jgi:heme/copper-type cytochrome/quinol oxidase subunit 3